MFRLLLLIDSNKSISNLFQWGYSYASIIKWYMNLMAEGYIQNDEEGCRSLTSKGKNKLEELETKFGKNSLEILHQYKKPQMNVVDIYLPK